MVSSMAARVVTMIATRGLEGPPRSNRERHTSPQDNVYQSHTAGRLGEILHLSIYQSAQIQVGKLCR